MPHCAEDSAAPAAALTTRHPRPALPVSRWINSFSDRLYYRHLHGDKDTFPLAFAAAGKAHCYSQVHTPPGERWSGGPVGWGGTR